MQPPLKIQIKGKYRMKLKKAFTLAELMMVIAVSATIGIITIGTYTGVEKYLNKVKLNNTTLEFKNGINSVITNPNYYTDDGDLANTKEVKVENAYDGSERIHKGRNKFRSLLLYELKVLESSQIPCYIMSDNKNVSYGNCYKGQNNVIWGIPDTDFTEVGITFSSDASGSVYKYVPITVYPPSAKYATLSDFNKYAVIFGVRRDGDITIINNIDCSDLQYKDYNQCKVRELMSSKS